MANTHTIPPPPGQPIAKPATARAMDLIHDAGHLDGARPRELSPGDADDLIAQMADAQINDLLAADDDGQPPPARPAPQPIEPEAIAPPDSPKPVALASPLESTPIEVVARHDPLPALDPLPPLPSAEAAFPASFSPPQSKRPQVPAAPEAAPPADPAAMDVATSASELADLLALPAGPAPVTEATPAHELQSSAEAVAAELAADARLTPARAAASEPPAPGPAAASKSNVIHDVPAAALGLINYPVSALSDGAREAIGAVAIVTLANATALLIYLVLYRA